MGQRGVVTGLCRIVNICGHDNQIIVKAIYAFQGLLTNVRLQLKSVMIYRARMRLCSGGKLKEKPHFSLPHKINSNAEFMLTEDIFILSLQRSGSMIGGPIEPQGCESGDG